MKSIVACCAALLLGSAAIAAPAQQLPGPMQMNQMPPLTPRCVTGFAYSVKEQFGNPATGHLWYFCRADVTCPNAMTASTQGPIQNFRFVYRCPMLTPGGTGTACAPGFSPGSLSMAANIPGCLTPIIHCPTNFAAMVDTATLSADKRSVRFEYQCYRPGT